MPRKAFPCLIGLVILVLLAHWQCPQVMQLLPILEQHGRLGGDYHNLYYGLKALHSGVCIYDDQAYFAFCEAQQTGHQATAIFNPPAFFLLMEPFGGTDFLSSFWAFELTSGLLALISLVMLCLALWRSRALALSAAGLAWVVLLNSPQGVDNLALGQLGYWLVSAFILNWLFDQWNRPAVASFFLTWAIFLKMWPILLLAYFARRRRWKVVLYTFVWLAFFGLIQLGRLGVPLHLAYVRHFGSTGLSTGVMSQSIIGVLTTWFGAKVMPLATSLNLVFMVLGLSLLWKSSAGLAGCTPQAARQRQLLEYSCYLLLALMCSAWSWPHHRLIWILPILALSATCELEADDQPRGPWNLALFALCFYWVFDGEIVQLPLMFQMHQMLGALGLGLACSAFAWFCLGYTLHKTQGQSKGTRAARPVEESPRSKT